MGTRRKRGKRETYTLSPLGERLQRKREKRLGGRAGIQGSLTVTAVRQDDDKEMTPRDISLFTCNFLILNKDLQRLQFSDLFSLMNQHHLVLMLYC